MCEDVDDTVKIVVFLSKVPVVDYEGFVDLVEKDKVVSIQLIASLVASHDKPMSG